MSNENEINEPEVMHTLVVIDSTLTPRVIWYEPNLNDLLQSVDNMAHNLGYVFKPDTNVFGGYYVNPKNGDSYFVDYPLFE